MSEITNDDAQCIAQSLYFIALLDEFLESSEYIAEIKSEKGAAYRLPYGIAFDIKTNLKNITKRAKKEYLKDLKEWVEQ